MGEDAALAYSKIMQASTSIHSVEGDLSEETLKSVFEEDEARLYLAFIGDAIVKARPHYEGEPKRFWMVEVKRLLEKHAPQCLETNFFKKNNLEEQQTLYDEMLGRIVPRADDLPILPYGHCVVLGYVSLKNE